MTAVILNDTQFSTYNESAAATLEMATEMLQHRIKMSAIVSAALDAVRNVPDNVEPLLQVLEDLAFDTEQDERLIQKLESMQEAN